jgi:hypothetical protein
MHSQDTIDQCLKLRADGKTCRRIAEELDLSLATVTRWSQEHKAAIQQMRAARLEALHEQYLGNYEEKLSDLAHEIASINTELKLRDFGDVSTEFLLYRKTCLQARLEKLAARETATTEPQPPALEPDTQPQSAEQMSTN